jgi:hypothetical protein
MTNLFLNGIEDVFLSVFVPGPIFFEVSHLLARM